ncbi:tol-pal system protein YbgF [Salaquimonas pukyongi]|uniref:tol-pal system protein YbgF n=1 Tax=Salaquimonas pukyongi TaxID=2712698 RepID=UPI0009F8E08F|nr:tol-pal system protein YbgF [Salaquimonas pukyongi]
MKRSSSLKAAAVLAALALPGPAFAASQDGKPGYSGKPLAGLLQGLDVRGGEKAGAAGYENPVPGVSAGNPSGQANPIVTAQASDAAFRINQLEEQVRVLNGQVEEMNFQLLQLQEQLRKMQEDNEFRFQELEDRSDASGGASAEENSLGKSKPSDSAAGNGESDGSGTRKSLTDLIEENSDAAPALGEPPASLGTLTFDADGNLVDTNVGKPVDLTQPGQQSSLAPQALPATPDERFNLGYQYVQAGEYAQAEMVFRSFMSDFDGDDKTSDAAFWLGESLFSQGKYDEAARIFLENHKAYPQAPLAAQNLLKLGVSLAGLEQRELACATYAEVPKKYPQMSNAVRKRVAIEQQAAKCKNG